MKEIDVRKIFTQREMHNFSLTLLAFDENGDLKAILESYISRLQVSLNRKYYLFFLENTLYSLHIQ